MAAAQGQLALAEAGDRLLRAGSWEADREVARAQCEESRALVAQAQVELDRLTVKAPIAGTVLQVNVRVGEACPQQPDRPPVVLGDLSTLHVRVELEEQQIARFRSLGSGEPGVSAPGVLVEATPRGQRDLRYRLKLVRIEPLVVPRRIPTGDIGERSDVRVLPVIYRLEEKSSALYVGQQMEVFIETKVPAPFGVTR